MRKTLTVQREFFAGEIFSPISTIHHKDEQLTVENLIVENFKRCIFRALQQKTNS